MEGSDSTTESAAPDAARALALAIFWFVAITLGFSLAGVVLAIIGGFTPVAFVAGGSVAATAIVSISWKPYGAAVRDLLNGGVAPVIAVVVIIVVSGLSAGVFSSEHLLTNRDPGVYVTTAKWLADDGTLLVDGAVGGFAGIEGVTGSSLGYYDVRDDGQLNPQFMHLLPVWGAAAQWIGGDQALLRVNAVIIAGAIAAFWLLAAMVLRKWYAVLATLALAVNLVTVHFARDLYSEPLALLLVFAALAFFAAAEQVQHPGLSLVAGLLAGATAAARIDAWLVIIAFVMYLEIRWYVYEQHGDIVAIARVVQPALAGILIGGAVALADGFLRSAPYIAGRSQQFFSMMLLLLIVLVGGVVARIGAGYVGRPRWFGSVRRVASWLIPALIVLSAITLFVVRPSVQETHGSAPNPVVVFAQDAEDLSSDPTRTYQEWSMHWLSWYLGLGGLAAGIVGLAWSWRRAIDGRYRVFPFVLVASLTTAVYLIRPSIVPDQLWAMRRFMPVTIPALILGGAILAEWGSDRWPLPAVRWSAGVGALLLLVLIPASFTWPLRFATSHRSMYETTMSVCDAVSPRSAIIMVDRFHMLTYQAAIRSFCGIPVAGIDDSIDDPACAIEEARQNWAQRGITLYVGSASGAVDTEVVIETTSEIPEIVLTRRPNRVIATDFHLDLRRAEAPKEPACG